MASALLVGSHLKPVPFTGCKLGKQCSIAPVRRTSVVPLTVVAGWGRLPKVGPGKKWEHYELNHNGNPVKVPMHVKKGDTVVVIAGKQKGTVSTITRVLTMTGMVYVSGVNIVTKHIKPTGGQKGSIKKSEAPIHHSNVMLWSKTQQVRSRVGHKVLEDGRKVRYLIKTGEVID